MQRSARRRLVLGISVAIAAGALGHTATVFADKNTPLRWEERDRWEQYLPEHQEYWESQWRWYDETYRPYYDQRSMQNNWELESYIKRYPSAYRSYTDYYQAPPGMDPSYAYPATSPAPPGFGTGDWRYFPENQNPWR